jgi:hypothetical protein
LRSSPVYPQSWPCHSIWKESFWRSDFSPQISSKTPKSSRDGAQKKEEREKLLKKEEEKEKLQGVSSNKGEVNILRGEKYFNFKDPFWCDSIFSPSIIPFEKPFLKSLRKFS